MLTHYSPTEFYNLQEFPIAKRCLVNARQHLMELGGIICKHNVHQQVGIALLHKHFELSAHERLVEEPVANGFIIQPVANDAETELIPYLWKAAPIAQGETHWFPLEFARVQQATMETQTFAQSIAASEAFLTEMACKLSTLQLANIFGLCTLHRTTLTPGTHEIVLETTDDVNRVLKLAVTPEQQTSPDRITQTLWRFAPTTTPDVAGYCWHCTHCSHCDHMG